MELRNLITFIHVAELGSFTKAAEQLGYSQSTISFQIKQLEEELDCLLFERINHTISLTERGRELVSYAHKVRELTEEFKENLRMARECIGQMRTSLNFDYSLSRNLFAIYCFADRELAKDIYAYKTENLDVIQTIFTKLHDAYYVVSQKDDSAPLMDNIQTVYAGLTYTKSDLNEDFLNYDAKRGYLA